MRHLQVSDSSAPMMYNRSEKARETFFRLWHEGSVKSLYRGFLGYSGVHLFVGALMIQANLRSGFFIEWFLWLYNIIKLEFSCEPFFSKGPSVCHSSGSLFGCLFDFPSPVEWFSILYHGSSVTLRSAYPRQVTTHLCWFQAADSSHICLWSASKYDLFKLMLTGKVLNEIFPLLAFLFNELFEFLFLFRSPSLPSFSHKPTVAAVAHFLGPAFHMQVYLFPRYSSFSNQLEQLFILFGTPNFLLFLVASSQ